MSWKECQDLPRSYVIQSFYYAASNVVAHVWLINTLIGSRFIQDLIFKDSKSSKVVLVLDIRLVLLNLLD
ncbi:hypothetical protein RI543_000538 [Arxiozyma heterogenica]|uniref:Uncharacterized protein n=1 Tax=Arxiozyma heterogenica TaxID=278026 RepID=A0AAN7WQU1_9SACH|nr:hypothetical protein RI543_000538 [Kazachstania heterogenica]